MDHKMWYDDKEDLLFLEFTRDYLLSDVKDIKQNITKLLDAKPYRQMVIVISNTHKIENRETREQSNQVIYDTNISEVAFIGGNAANRMMAKVLLKTGALKTKGDFFKNTEDAVNWLKNKR
jgi:hypothetical protein